MTNRCVAALGVVLAFGATAASSAEKHREHVFATKVERLLAQELGVNWSAYDREVSSK